MKNLMLFIYLLSLFCLPALGQESETPQYFYLHKLELSHTWSSFGEAKGKLNAPHGIRIDAQETSGLPIQGITESRNLTPMAKLSPHLGFSAKARESLTNRWIWCSLPKGISSFWKG